MSSNVSAWLTKYHSLCERLRGWGGVEEELEVEQYRVRVEGWQDRGSQCAGYWQLKEQVEQVQSPEEAPVEDFYRIFPIEGEEEVQDDEVVEEEVKDDEVVEEEVKDDEVEEEDGENDEEQGDWGEDAELFSTSISTAFK